MTIRNLKNIPFEDVVACLLCSFSDYFVTMPTDIDYWRKRFMAARVDFEMSFGAFDHDKLVAFIVNGIDHIDYDLVAFNTGTGVIADYRGQKLIDEIYGYGIPVLKKNGVTRCVLEVIQKNDRAISVYERIGFSKIRDFKCYRGSLDIETSDIAVAEVNFVQIIHKQNISQGMYSWDNRNEAILLLNDVYQTYEVSDPNRLIGYFVLNPSTGNLPQFELYDPVFNGWAKLFAGIQKVTESVKINNIDVSRATVCRQMQEIGLENHIDQYEMSMLI